MSAEIAPAGTSTFRVVPEAVSTLAFIPPKKTLFSERMELKLAPDIVICVPTGPLAGVKDVIKGPE